MPVRATVSDFGPLLLAKILEANETQEGSLSLVFRYADEKGLPILDLADLRALLSFLDSDEGKADLKGIGGVSSATIVLLRKLVQLEDGGGTEFFGEPQLDIADLLRVDSDGRGIISCLELPAVQDKPKLFSTVLMWLLAELFEQLPEVGDVPKPKLVFFFDEAHLLFADVTDAFLDSVVQTVRLIRSKGVGVFFITQTPKDGFRRRAGPAGQPDSARSRAFTPQDAKALKASVSTYPTSDFYDLEELLTQLGTGEAAVTILSEKGVPTPVVHTRLRGPLARMEPADDVDGAAKPRRCMRSTGRRPIARALGSCSRGWSRPRRQNPRRRPRPHLRLAAAGTSRPSAVIRSPTSSAPRTARGSSERSFAACSACAKACSGGPRRGRAKPYPWRTCPTRSSSASRATGRASATC